MCGRFTLAISPEQLVASFPWLEVPEMPPARYNIAPSQPVGVIPNDGKGRLDYFVWGLVPSWAKDPKIGNRMINARAETLAEKPSFRNAFKYRRCLILADGFYEWRKIPGNKTKIPTYIHLKDGKPFAFAGLWEEWNSPDGSQILSTTIITTEPNELVKPVHNRMPVILEESAYNKWLKPGESNTQELINLLRPYEASQMEAYPVSQMVNNPRNDHPNCIQPL